MRMSNEASRDNRGSCEQPIGTGQGMSADQLSLASSIFSLIWI